MPFERWAGAVVIAVGGLGLPTAAHGAVTPAAAAKMFIGPYAGIEAGLHEHHFYLMEVNTVTNGSRGRYYRGWGPGGGAFIGRDFRFRDTIRVGIEGGISVGGKGARADFADGSYFYEKPRVGLRATGRLGFVLSERLMLYGTAGYGGHSYRYSVSPNLEKPSEWGSSFTVGGGFEYRLSDKADLRIDFRHLDNQMSHLLIGVPIRF